MNPSRLQWPTVRRLCLGVVAAFTLPVIGQQPGPDRTKKEVIEPPVVKVVTDSAPATPPGGDPGKRKIEFPAKRVVAGTQPSDATAQPRSETENPTVKPGDVKWHPSFAVACEAAKKSGKPVLLFHMMGQLDKQFC